MCVILNDMPWTMHDISITHVTSIARVRLLLKYCRNYKTGMCVHYSKLVSHAIQEKLISIFQCLIFLGAFQIFFVFLKCSWARKFDYHLQP